MVNFDETTVTKILPYYAGVHRLSDVLKEHRTVRYLWLEILFNDTVKWEEMDNPLVQEAFHKASLWYSQYRRLISSSIQRAPLPYRSGKIDRRDERQFMEGFQFVCSRGKSPY